uniref:Uncharacterized protein n=1 Tax=Caenorhabditis japonica TaxID=281687 RepID=A0A8R1IX40_CAEJA
MNGKSDMNGPKTAVVTNTLPRAPNSVNLMSTQMDTFKPKNSPNTKDSLAKRNRRELKQGEINEHSDDTFEDAPSLPKKPSPSYEQLDKEVGRLSPSTEKTKK